MRKTICASVLVLALCGSALAGDIHTPPAPAPSTISTLSEPQTSGVQAAESGCEDPAADGIIYGDYADGIEAAALAALNSVLALL